MVQSSSKEYALKRPYVKKIVSENELQLVRQDHTYELWDIRYIKLIKDPKINSNIVDDIELYIV